MTKLNELMAKEREQRDNGTFEFRGELHKQVDAEMMKSIEALDQLKVLILMDANATIPLSEVSTMFDIPAEHLSSVTNSFADELESDGYLNGQYTKRSIYRLAMFLPSGSYLVEKINNYILNVNVN